MNLRALFISLLVILSRYCYSQSTTVPQVTPPSPVTHEFEKYINYNVSMYNGLPEISIPLYTIELKGLKIPINLSYHASGIKFGQLNGDVGVGWTLNPGYRVSRTIYGQPDERYPMPDYLFDSLSYYESNDVAFRDKWLSKFVDRDIPNIPNPDNNLDRLDGEYDFFHYILPTENGSFAITNRTNKTIQTIEQSNIRINYATGASSNGYLNGILNLDAVDEQGNKYLFGERAGTGASVFETSSKYGSYLGTAWALTDIITANGDQLNFKYIRGPVGGWNSTYRAVTVREAIACSMGIPSEVDYTYGTSNGYSTFFLDELNTSTEKVKITRESGANRVTQIDIYSIANVLIKAINFYYSSNIHHIFLDSIKISDKNRSAVEVYKFNYYLKDVSPMYSADQWGYYSRMGDVNKYLHLEFADDRILHLDQANIPAYPTVMDATAFFADFGNRTSPADNYFMLKSIVYPTGGSTEYVYESNSYMSRGTQKWGGGFRIKSITSNDSVNNSTLRREYRYGENESGYGRAQLDIDESLFVNEEVMFRREPPHYEINEQVPQRIITYSTQICGDVDATGFLASYVVYPSVTEYYAENDFSIPRGGKIEYKYKLGLQYGADAMQLPISDAVPCGVPVFYANSSPMYVNMYSYWDKPRLEETKYYSYLNNQYNLIKKDSFDYVSNYTILRGLKVKPFASAEVWYPTEYRYYEFINSFFKVGEYVIHCGKNLLKEKRERVYGDNGNSILTKSEYEYNGKNQLKKVTRYINDALNIEEYSYASDFTGLNISNSVNKPILLLQEKNMLSSIVEKRIFKANNDGTQKRLLSSAFTENNATLALPAKTYTVQENLPLLNFAPAQVINGNITKDTHYSLELSFDKYGSWNNIEQMHKQNDINTCIIWGYNNRYPVANITGSDYNTAIAFVNQTIIQNPASDQQLRDELQKIRSGLSGTQALVTTYTYTPLLGMTSETNPSGKTIFYEYDDFGRLKLIKDKDGKILTLHDYQYQKPITQ